MRKFIVLLVSVLSLPPMSMAEEKTTIDYCESSNYVTPYPSTLTCNNGNCTTNIQWPSLNANGRCTSGKIFSAYGYVFPMMASGRCNNGFIQLMVPSQSIQFNGTCNAGRLNANPTYTQTQFVSSACNSNGSSTLFLQASYVQFSGYCVE